MCLKKKSTANHRVNKNSSRVPMFDIIRRIFYWHKNECFVYGDTNGMPRLKLYVRSDMLSKIEIIKIEKNRINTLSFYGFILVDVDYS